ncbi:transporter substrate-binding domain-containing protein [Kurthia sibirica]|uniref:ABC transporter substrate-binding protein n=1 Tax=Kurthia sibirica TaxID=202750 RepID=A0A2U3AMB2_9BACL|nr:transporter substrate-binding domain-containing protein [Kurthia sibirica]PWI25683.1 ABC transporter substrate-binding protein [Kurthia sibirica]GEK33688.1 ABC transporter substrate-binding protein [Kurthia sibirica]
MKKSFSLLSLLMLMLVLVLSACGSKDKESGSGDSSSDDNKTLKIGMEAGYPPFNWTQKDDSNGAVKIDGNAEYAGGYDVQIAKLVAEKLDRKLVIVKTEWDGLIPALISNKIDGVIAGMSPTKERLETIDFSDIYYTSDLVMVVRADSKYADAKSIKDFKDAKITGQLNTFHYSVIDQIPGVKKETAVESFPTMRVALESGKIDGYVSERPEGISAAMANDKFVMVEFDDGEGFQASTDDTAIAVGLKKGSDLTADINKALKEITEEQRQKIMDEAIAQQPAAK